MGVPPEEFRTDRAEQLSLFSTEELGKLEPPSGSRSPQEGEVQSSDATRARKAPPTNDSAIQDQLPGF